MKITAGDWPGSQLSVAVRFSGAGKPAEQETVMLAGGNGALKTGGTLSTILMVCVNTTLLPQSSEADQVRVTMLFWGHEPGPELWLKVTGTLVSHRSVAVTVGAAGGVCVQEMVRVAAGNPFRVGGVRSRIAMVCVCCVEFPQLSGAVQVRVMVLFWGQVPGAVFWLNVTCGLGSRASVALRVGAVGTGSLQLMVIFCGRGRSNTGGTLSPAPTLAASVSVQALVLPASLARAV